MQNSRNLIADTVGVSFYNQCVGHIPPDLRPRITTSGSAVMPGQQYVSQLERIGDARTLGHLTPQDDRTWDRAVVFNHYLKGVKLKWELAGKLGIQDRTSLVDCALGYGMNNHFYVDEFGLSLTENKAFPPYIVEAAMIYMKQVMAVAIRKEKEDNSYAKINLSEYSKVRASYPRGKNTGLPWMVSGKDRFQNDLVIATNALLAKLLVDGVKTSELFPGKLLAYMVFSRYQRVSKEIPMMMERPSTSFGFEPRRRTINATPKALAMAVKPLVKWWTVLSLRTEVFSQDRARIQSRVKKAKVTFASDASRFDLRSGGVKLKQGLQLLWDIAVHFHPDIPPGVYDTMMEEAFLPAITPYGYPEAAMYLSHGDKHPSLRSGASTTSRVGSLLNLMYDMIVESARIGSKDPKVIADYYIRYEPSAILSDDLLKVYSAENVAKYGGEESYTQHMGDLEKLVGMKAELELPTKFLGYLIDDSRTLTHGTSPLDNMFFPERFTTNPVSSMLMRYIILKHPKASDALSKMTEIMRSEAVAGSVYKDFYRDCGPSLKAHYEDHPSGAARMFFQAIKPEYTGAQVQKNLFADVDSVLIFISKGSAYDFNYSLIGLPQLDDLIAERDEVVTGSLDEFVSQASTVARGSKMDSVSPTGADADKVWVSALAADAKKFGKVKAVLRLFEQSRPQEIINVYNAMLPVVARRVATGAGEMYMGNL